MTIAVTVRQAEEAHGVPEDADGNEENDLSANAQNVLIHQLGRCVDLFDALDSRIGLSALELFCVNCFEVVVEVERHAPASDGEKIHDELQQATVGHSLNSERMPEQTTAYKDCDRSDERTMPGWEASRDAIAKSS